MIEALDAGFPPVFGSHRDPIGPACEFEPRYPLHVVFPRVFWSLFGIDDVLNPPERVRHIVVPGPSVGEPFADDLLQKRVRLFKNVFQSGKVLLGRAWVGKGEEGKA